MIMTQPMKRLQPREVYKIRIFLTHAPVTHRTTLDGVLLRIKTWYVTSSEEHRLRVFETMDLSNILGLREK